MQYIICLKTYIFYKNFIFSKIVCICNVVAIWPRHVILLVITSNNILLRLPIVLTYHIIPNSLFFQYTKLHPSIVRN